MSLLSELQQLQTDNCQLQSQLIARQRDLRRRDLIIDWQARHDRLARVIISRQRVLVADQGVRQSAELQQLTDVYEKQSQQIDSWRRGCFLPPVSTNKVSSTTDHPALCR